MTTRDKPMPFGGTCIRAAGCNADQSALPTVAAPILLKKLVNFAAMKPNLIIHSHSGKDSLDRRRATQDRRKTCARTARWRDLLFLAVILSVGLDFVPSALAQFTYQRLKSFGVISQSATDPLCSLIQGSDGALYGTSKTGGDFNFGTVFKVNKDGSGYQVLHSFAGGTDLGGNPLAGLIQGQDGSLYGTTSSTVFKLNTDGSGYVVLLIFTSAAPSAPLIQGNDGMLYGTTKSGGSANLGSVFEVNTNGSGYIVLHNFTGAGGDGQQPVAGLVQGADGYLYGTTVGGGSGSLGTVFKLNTGGTGYQVLVSFTGLTGASPGSGPEGSLIQGGDGALYGTANSGGANNDSTVFKVNTDGSGYTVLVNFTGNSGANPGSGPAAAVIQGSDGALYGTTVKGGNKGDGTVFKLNTDGTGFQSLYAFQYTQQFLTSAVDGSSPYGSLIQASDGSLYGTTSLGGPNTGSVGSGTIFKLNTDGSGYVILLSLSPSGDDGYNPESTLIQGHDGALYGTTYNGGIYGWGTVFKINPDGTGYSIIHNFSGINPDGYDPAAGVIQGADGFLYGTTVSGPATADGTVFKLNTDGTGYTALHIFSGTDGSDPFTPLMQGSDGLLYGTTEFGGTGSTSGSSGYGTVFRLNTDGTGFTVLTKFTGASGAYPGSNPQAGLIQGTDHALYGATSQYNTTLYGTIFKLNTDGSGYMVLTNFPSYGQYAFASLLQAVDGALYGTTVSGGTAGGGTVFKINTNGTGYTELFNFTNKTGTVGSPHGSAPQCSLIQGNNGFLFGTTYSGGISNFGTVFMLNTNGTGYSLLHTFVAANGDGLHPGAGLIQAQDGSLFGTTQYGGDFQAFSGDGTIFTLLAPPTITAATSVCANSTDNQASGPSGAVSYGWTITGGTITSATNTQTVTYTAGASGNVVLTLTVPTGNNSATILINPVPDNSFSVTGGGAYDSAVGLSGSQSGIHYQLQVNGSPTGSPIPGTTGSAINFGNQTKPGTYTVVAANASGCSSVMSGSVVVNAPLPPIAINQSVAIPQDTSLAIILTGSDPNTPSLPLTYTVTQSPVPGTLSGTAPALTYAPSTGYTGPDSFNFYVNNGVLNSPTATVSINVVPAGQNLNVTANVAAGQTATTTLPPESGQAGVTATLNNTSGGQETVTATADPSNPESMGVFSAGTTFVDLQVLGATAGDSMTAQFFGPGAPPPAPAPSLFYYPTGGPWTLVKNSTSAPSYPGAPPVPAWDGSANWVFTVYLDGTSTPTLANLTGTVFAMGAFAPPVSGASQLGATENTAVNTPVANLVANASSPNNGALNISAVAASSAQGGTVTLAGGMVTYTAPANFLGSDSFTYTLSDGFSTAQGTVIISVGPVNTPSQNAISITPVPGMGEFILEFQGDAVSTYVVQSAAAVTGPWADLSGDLTPGASGLIIYTLTTPSAVEQYYRIRPGP